MLFYESVHKSAPHDGFYILLTHRFTNSRNCKFNFSLSGHFSLHKSSGMSQHHAGGLMCPDRQPDNKSSGQLKKADQLDKSGWFLVVRLCVRRSPLIWPDRQPDKLSSGPLKKAGQLDKSGWFLVVRLCVPTGPFKPNQKWMIHGL